MDWLAPVAININYYARTIVLILDRVYIYAVLERTGSVYFVPKEESSRMHTPDPPSLKTLCVVLGDVYDSGEEGCINLSCW